MRAASQNISPYLQLCKMKISLFSALSAAAGFCVSSSKLSMAILLPVLGVFVLACGSSALNQYQEREIDLLMARTKDRPLPSGRIKPLHALYVSGALIGSGFLLLAVSGSLPAALLGLFAVLWYNGIYTYLKRKTAFAVIPGALVGAIPPAIGWMLGGGGLLDPRLPALCFFFFMWQVPHFWALLLHYGGEYEKAGLPSLSGIFSRRQLVRITSHWIFATVVSSLFLFLYDLVHTPATVFLLFLSTWFLWQAFKLIRGEESNERQGKAIFTKINYYMASVIVLISVDQFMGYRMLSGLIAFMQ